MQRSSEYSPTCIWKDTHYNIFSIQELKIFQSIWNIDIKSVKWLEIPANSQEWKITDTIIIFLNFYALLFYNTFILLSINSTLILLWIYYCLVSFFFNSHFYTNLAPQLLQFLCKCIYWTYLKTIINPP